MASIVKKLNGNASLSYAAADMPWSYLISESHIYMSLRNVGPPVARTSDVVSDRLRAVLRAGILHKQASIACPPPDSSEPKPPTDPSTTHLPSPPPPSSPFNNKPAKRRMVAKQVTEMKVFVLGYTKDPKFEVPSSATGVSYTVTYEQIDWKYDAIKIYTRFKEVEGEFDEFCFVGAAVETGTQLADLIKMRKVDMNLPTHLMAAWKRVFGANTSPHKSYFCISRLRLRTWKIDEQQILEMRAKAKSANLQLLQAKGRTENAQRLGRPPLLELQENVDERNILFNDGPLT